MNNATLTLPPVAELEERLRAVRQEAAMTRKLLRIRRHLDAAEEARRRREQRDPPTPPG